MQRRIAILGATGHIAKGLIYSYSKSEQTELFLFARSIDRLNEFLKEIDCFQGANITTNTFDTFNLYNYDVIINCVGMGNPTKDKNELYSIFRVTESFDNLVLYYLETHKNCIYINFSSGAAYGTEFNLPVDEKSVSIININNLTDEFFYSISKINAEAKHRAYKEFRIVDIRVFGYFSRFINQESSYLLNDIISCVKNKKCLRTSRSNIIRDYVNMKDLRQLIDKCILNSPTNDVFDVYSLKPISKFEIIEYFEKEYGLRYEIDDNITFTNVTGSKSNYFSNNNKAQQIGYIPELTSLDAISEEVRYILG